jgi:hypothetical protein
MSEKKRKNNLVLGYTLGTSIYFNLTTRLSGILVRSKYIKKDLAAKFKIVVLGKYYQL